eukprot:227322-Pleurochrysis_carterae.AAC.1
MGSSLLPQPPPLRRYRSRAYVQAKGSKHSSALPRSLPASAAAAKIAHTTDRDEIPSASAQLQDLVDHHVARLSESETPSRQRARLTAVREHDVRARCF